MEPNIHQPDSLDAAPTPRSASKISPVGKQVSDVATEASEFAKDWQYAQKALVARWNGLTSDDFVVSDGDRDAFVERLASRCGISQFEAANDLTAFEAHQPIHWRRRTPTARSKR